MTARRDAEMLKDRPSPSRSVGFTAAELCTVAALAMSADSKRLAVSRANRVVVHDLKKTPCSPRWKGIAIPFRPGVECRWW